MIRFQEFYPFCRYMVVGNDKIHCQFGNDEPEMDLGDGICCEAICRILKHSHFIQNLDVAKKMIEKDKRKEVRK